MSVRVCVVLHVRSDNNIFCAVAVCVSEGCDHEHHNQPRAYTQLRTVDHKGRGSNESDFDKPHRDIPDAHRSCDEFSGVQQNWLQQGE